MMAVAKDHANVALVLAETVLMIVTEDAHAHGANAPEETAIPQAKKLELYTAQHIE